MNGSPDNPLRPGDWVAVKDWPAGCRLDIDWTTPLVDDGEGPAPELVERAARHRGGRGIVRKRPRGYACLVELDNPGQSLGSGDLVWFPTYELERIQPPSPEGELLGCATKGQAAEAVAAMAEAGWDLWPQMVAMSQPRCESAYQRLSAVWSNGEDLARQAQLLEPGEAIEFETGGIVYLLLRPTQDDLGRLRTLSRDTGDK